MQAICKEYISEKQVCCRVLNSLTWEKTTITEKNLEAQKLRKSCKPLRKLQDVFSIYNLCYG